MTSGQTFRGLLKKHSRHQDPLPDRHWERISGKKYYGAHSAGSVLLCDGFPVFHGKDEDVSEFIEKNNITLFKKEEDT
jgi:hypothetical protein